MIEGPSLTTSWGAINLQEVRRLETANGPN